MLVKTLQQFITAHGLSGKTLIVGVSGGADSLALLHGLVQIMPKQIVVGHVDHGLREESAEDAHHVKTICHHWNVPCHTVKLNPAAFNSTAIEETARRERYRALATIAQSVGTNAILTAHHADDQAETVLMHVMRGAGLSGLGGMQPVSALPFALNDTQKLYRPLLSLFRDDIIFYCQFNRIKYVEDHTNGDLRFFRNRIRHQLLPSLSANSPKIREHLQQLAAISSADSELLDTLEQQAYQDILIASGGGWREFAQPTWAALPLGLRRRTIRAALRDIDPALSDIGFVAIEAARQIGEKGKVGKQAALPGGHLLTVGYDRLTICERDALPPLDVPQILQTVTMGVPCIVDLADGWRISAEIVQIADFSKIAANSDLAIAYIPITNQITVRGRAAGERVRRLGASGSTKLKRVMIDCKIPERVREKWPLVEVNGEIVWIVGKVLMEAGRVWDWSNDLSHSTETCLRLQLRRSL